MNMHMCLNLHVAMINSRSRKVYMYMKSLFWRHMKIFNWLQNEERNLYIMYIVVKQNGELDN